MIHGINLLGIFGCMGMLYFTYLYHKRGDLPKWPYRMWFAVWSFGIPWLAFSEQIKPFVSAFHLGRMLDLTFCLGLLFSFCLLFLIHARVEKALIKIEKAVRIIAIENAENEEEVPSVQ